MEMHAHPFTVHFPIALILVAALLDWGRWFLDRERLLSAGFWCGTTPILIVALLGAGIAVLSGILAEENALQLGLDHEMIETHELAAFFTTGGLAILTFWRIALRGTFPSHYRTGYLLLLLVVVATVLYGGYLGGMIVYGSAASPMTQSP